MIGVREGAVVSERSLFSYNDQLLALPDWPSPPGWRFAQRGNQQQSRRNTGRNDSIYRFVSYGTSLIDPVNVGAYIRRDDGNKKTPRAR